MNKRLVSLLYVVFLINNSIKPLILTAPYYARAKVARNLGFWSGCGAVLKNIVVGAGKIVVGVVCVGVALIPLLIVAGVGVCFGAADLAGAALVGIAYSGGLIVDGVVNVFQQENVVYKDFIQVSKVELRRSVRNLSGEPRALLTTEEHKAELADLKKQDIKDEQALAAKITEIKGKEKVTDTDKTKQIEEEMKQTKRLHISRIIEKTIRDFMSEIDGAVKADPSYIKNEKKIGELQASLPTTTDATKKSAIDIEIVDLNSKNMVMMTAFLQNPEKISQVLEKFGEAFLSNGLTLDEMKLPVFRGYLNACLKIILVFRNMKVKAFKNRTEAMKKSLADIETVIGKAQKDLVE